MARILARILDVSVRPYGKDGKQLAEVVMKSGSEVVQASMFDADVKEGKHKVFENNLGKELIVDVSAEVYRDKLQYRFGFDTPQPPAVVLKAVS